MCVQQGPRLSREWEVSPWWHPSNLRYIQSVEAKLAGLCPAALFTDRQAQSGSGQLGVPGEAQRGGLW